MSPPRRYESVYTLHTTIWRAELDLESSQASQLQKATCAHYKQTLSVKIGNKAALYETASCASAR